LETTAKIAALGRLCGIAPEYRDNFGRRRRTSSAAYRALLTAMRIPWADPARLDQELARRRLQPFDRLVEPVQVFYSGSRTMKVAVFPWTAALETAPPVAVRAELTGEDGQRLSWEAALQPLEAPARRQLTDGWRRRLELILPARLAAGYYDLDLSVQVQGLEEAGRTRLIVAPRQVYLPAWLAAGGRAWGLNLPLYALKSRGHWGLGDFGDLMEMISWAGELEAAFVGVNPLHAAAPQAEADPSPYSPTSRLFINFLYLNLEMVPEFGDCPEAQALLELNAGRGSELVAYPAVYRLKRQALEMLYQTFQKLHGPPEAPRTPRGREFAQFLTSPGSSLTAFGQYCALADFFGQADWRRWPAGYQRPGRPEVAAFAREHTSQLHLHRYGQWLAAGQLGQVRHQARSQGLPFSLYLDLALGAAPGGFDTWAHQELFAQDAAMGAPGDAFNPKGQDWGLPPLIPERLRDSAYQIFIDTLRANMPPEGMLRLDHVMSLFRLFWVPAGRAAAAGTYVRYPARELLAILALESARRRTLVIGEDLGTLTPAIRRDLKKAGVFSYRVFYFERESDRRFRDPGDYPRQAVAAVTTHDLPTLAGYWQGQDVELKRGLHLYPEARQADAAAAAREQDRLRLVEALKSRGLLPADAPVALPAPGRCPEPLRLGVLEYLAQSRAALLEIRLEEIFGLPDQQNLPGTTREHPNWHRRLPLTLKEMRRAPEARRLAARLNRQRGKNNWQGGK
jgi:4-alpha-glucanotransferase